MIIRLTALLLLALFACGARAQDDDTATPTVPSELLLREEQPWNKPEVGAAELAPLLAEAEKWLAAVAKEPGPEAPHASLKAPLEQLAGALKELIALVERQGALGRVPDDLEAQIAAVRAETDALLQGPAPSLADGPPDSKAIEAAVAVVTSLRAEEAAAQDALQAIEDRLAAGPEAQKQATTRLTDARTSGATLVVPPDAQGTARTAAQLRQQNARLAVRGAEKLGEVLAAEVREAQLFLPLRRAQLERARNKTGMHATALEKLQAELKEELERRRHSLDDQVQAARQALEQARLANDPFAILRSIQGLWLAEHKRAQHRDEEELNQARARLQKEREFLKNEQVTFDHLKRIIEKGGRRGQLVAERLRPMYQRVQSDLRERKDAGLAEYSRRLAELQLDRAALSATDPGAEVRKELDPDAFGLKPYRRTRLAEDRIACEREREQEIGARLLLLGNLAQEYTELEGVALEIDEHLRSKHEYLLEQLFWIQEETPFTLAAARQGADQLAVLENALERAWTRDPPVDAGLAALRSGTRPWVTLAGLLVTPLLILFLRRRLRRYVRFGTAAGATPGPGATPAPAAAAGTGGAGTGVSLAGAPPGLAAGAPGDPATSVVSGPSGALYAPAGRFPAFAAATFSAVLWPAWLLLLSLLLGLDAATNGLQAAASSALAVVAAGATLHTFARAWFSAHGVFALHFGQPADACAGLDRMLRMTAWATILLLAPAVFLRQPGAACPATARIFYTGYEALLAVVLAWKLRKGGPVVNWFLGPRPGRQGSLVFRRWPILHGLAALAAVGIVALDVLGYRYGARVLAFALLKSVATLLALALLYRVALALAGRLDTVGRLLSTAPAGTPDTAEVRERVAESYRKFLRLVLGLAGAVVLAYAWGLDTRVLRTLDAVNLFAIHPEANVFVTLADALLAVLTTLVTWAILAHLDGVFEVLVFPYLGWDEGVRYAVLTLSRYVLFFAGLVLALAAVHVSLASLQWILAAAGVGIGFGLQEVVSNFVCGIILLIERPIRIGDIVTIGDTAGVVKKINIRATTVENANYESMIIPNREFIVGKVINWTHEDTVTRVVLRVPVRYGTDLEKAKAIMQRAVREHPLVPKEPAPGVWLTGFGDKGLEFLVFVYASVPDHRPVIQEEVLARIHREFLNEGIEIAWPNQDVHLRSVPPELLRWLADAARAAGRAGHADSPAPTAPSAAALAEAASPDARPAESAGTAAAPANSGFSPAATAAESLDPALSPAATAASARRRKRR